MSRTGGKSKAERSRLQLPLTVVASPLRARHAGGAAHSKLGYLPGIIRESFPDEQHKKVPWMEPAVDHRHSTECNLWTKRGFDCTARGDRLILLLTPFLDFFTLLRLRQVASRYRKLYSYSYLHVSENGRLDEPFTTFLVHPIPSICTQLLAVRIVCRLPRNSAEPQNLLQLRLENGEGKQLIVPLLLNEDKHLEFRFFKDYWVHIGPSHTAMKDISDGPYSLFLLNVSPKMKLIRAGVYVLAI